MQTSINALLPIILLILLGYGLHRARCFTDELWFGIEKLAYYVLTPALLIHALTANPLGNLPWKGLLLTLHITILSCALLMILWQRWGRPLDAGSFTSLFQGGLRFNPFIALALANALWGEEGLLYGALASVAMIILINILCVIIFAVAVPRVKLSTTNLLYQLATNPLIIGCVIGLSLNLFAIRLPDALQQTITLTGRAAFPIALLAVGAALEMRRLTMDWELMFTASLVQFIVKPLIAILLMSLIGLTDLPAMIAVLFLAVPTAPSSYILSRQLDGNYQAMAAIITFQTLIAFITLPVTLSLIDMYPL
ncbi:AEC family transporter [Amphritea sp. 1_MG-2023]|uniref:AEC family transporter n=1 Tax=Amphritea sp. 1_MG-2023 TaxID=3062670 RepID=UPI0026E1B555|nr:AEC family transporter [Amphritea sp. 1_MG-2023]MDO6565154.1 AEC family transporter [Amphritea sp. 1_MG-2023]